MLAKIIDFVLFDLTCQIMRVIIRITLRDTQGLILGYAFYTYLGLHRLVQKTHMPLLLSVSKGEFLSHHCKLKL